MPSMVELKECFSEACSKSMDEVSEKTFAAKCRHSCAMFLELRKFQKDGLLCDTTVRSGNKTMDVHRVVLLSAKSFDSDHNSDYESSESDIDDEVHRGLSCSDEAVFDDVYPAEDETSHSTAQMEHINTLRNKGECCDVTLQVTDEQFPVHKVVLAAASEYFKIMFTSSMKEKDLDFINLNIGSQLDVAELHNVIDFIYTGEIRLDDDNIFPVLCLSAFFLTCTLTQQCQNYLIDQLSMTNCCEFYVLAKCFALNDLKVESSRIIHDYFPELNCLSHNLNRLENIDFPAFLQSDNLGQCSNASKNSEKNVLGNVMEWLVYAKFHDASELLKHIRYNLVPKRDIESHCKAIRNSGTVENLKDVRSAGYFLQKALDYHEKLYEQPLLQKPNSSLRSAKAAKVSFDGVLAPELLKLPSTCLHAKLSSKEKQTNINGNRNIRDPFHSVVVLNGFVYVIGGTRQTCMGYSREVLRYDSHLDAWITVAPMNDERGDFYACVIDNYVYVFGGRNKRGVVKSCERYDPKSNQWKMISDLPQGLYMMAGVVENGAVYLSGGFTEYEAVGTTLKFDPGNNEWQELPTFMFKDRGYHVMMNDGHGHLWAIGGIDNPFAGRNVWEVERFDVKDQIWNYVGQVLAVQPFLSVQRLNSFIDGKGRMCVFAVTNIDHSPMMRYNIDGNLWEALNDPPDYCEITTDPY